MSALAIQGNSHLTSLDTKIIFDLPNGVILIDLSPTAWLSGGQNAVTNARLKIWSPSGQLLKDGTVNDFVPPMDQVVSVDIPKIAGVYEWGSYIFEVTLNDGINTYLLRKYFQLCPPQEDIKMNTGKAVFSLTPDCDAGIVTVHGGDGYSYQGKTASSWVRNFTFYFPPESNVAHIANIVNNPFQVNLYTGKSSVKGASVGMYAFDDNFQVIVRFIGEGSKDMRCKLNYCHIYCAMEMLLFSIDSSEVGSSNYEQLKAKYDHAVRYLSLIQLGFSCGKDIGEWLSRIETLLGLENCCRECGGDELGVKIGQGNTQPSTSSTTTSGPAASTSTTQAPTTSTTQAPTTSTTTQPATTSTTTQGATTTSPCVNVFLNYDYTEDGVLGGNFQVKKNGVVIFSTGNGDSSGSIMFVPGDLVEVRVTAPGTLLRSLKVTQPPNAPMHDSNGTSNRVYSFVMTCGDPVEVIASVQVTCPAPTDFVGVPTDNATTSTTSTTTAAPTTSTTTGTDHIFFGSQPDDGSVPTELEILAANDSYQDGSADVAIDYTGEGVAYHWVAIPDLGGDYTKNKWYVDALNNGDMGTESDLFGAPTTVNVGGTDYLVWITNYQTGFIGVTLFKKV